MNSGRAHGRLLAVPALLAGLLTPSICQATLVGPGDLAFIAINTGGSHADGTPAFDEFGIVLLADADVGQLVSFNTGVYNDVTGKFGIADHMVWEITDALAAGTVVTFIDLGRSRPPTVSEGLIQNPVDRMLTLPEMGTQISAYLGTDQLFPGTFLAGITTASTTTFAGTGLTLGETAIYLPPKGDSIDEAHYIGDRIGQASFDDYLPLIANLNANWATRGDTIPNGFPSFDASDFTLDNGAAVPESPLVVITGVLMLLACLSLGARWRRQSGVALAD